MESPSRKNNQDDIDEQWALMESLRLSSLPEKVIEINDEEEAIRQSLESFEKNNNLTLTESLIEEQNREYQEALEVDRRQKSKKRKSLDKTKTASPKKKAKLELTQVERELSEERAKRQEEEIIIHKFIITDEVYDLKLCDRRNNSIKPPHPLVVRYYLGTHNIEYVSGDGSYIANLKKIIESFVDES